MYGLRHDIENLEDQLQEMESDKESMLADIEDVIDLLERDVNYPDPEEMMDVINEAIAMLSKITREWSR